MKRTLQNLPIVNLAVGLLFLFFLSQIFWSPPFSSLLGAAVLWLGIMAMWVRNREPDQVVAPVQPKAALDPHQQAINDDHFRILWSGWSLEERLQFLKTVHLELANRYSLDPSRVKIVDLPDTDTIDRVGTYHHRRNKILLDIDNMDESDGIYMLKTLIHETRHSLQYELIDHYERASTHMPRPSDISKGQIAEWRNNRVNYIRLHQDVDGYLKQPLEQDARDFADVETPHFVNQALEQFSSHTGVLEV